MLTFPNIDPVALHFGPLQIRWYALAYLAGFLGGWYYAHKLTDLNKSERPNREDIDNILPLLVFGVILGGRIGYVLFYNLAYYIQNPMQVIEIWQGGMSFHGGLLGVAIAIFGYCRKHKIPILAMGDTISTVVPVGLFFGRIANFINGELFGRPTDVPWAMVFPRGGDMPRHPSQLYEAFLEGIVLFGVMYVLSHNENIRKKRGMLFAAMLIGYGMCRFIVEYVREPDPQLGLYFGNLLSMGQMMCLPMILAGIVVMRYARQKA